MKYKVSFYVRDMAKMRQEKLRWATIEYFEQSRLYLSLFQAVILTTLISLKLQI